MKILNCIRKCVVRLSILPFYVLGCLVYDKKLLYGKYFDRTHFSVGWTWIFKYFISQKIFRYNSNVPFPVPPYVFISGPHNIHFHPDDITNFHNVGCYYQAINAHIYIGKGTYIAPNCGLITSNHDIKNLSKSEEGRDININENCWIGMNSMILPGVELGKHTIVGAGSVVTKSFPDGNCILAGNPARIIREIGE